MPTLKEYQLSEVEQEAISEIKNLINSCNNQLQGMFALITKQQQLSGNCKYDPIKGILKEVEEEQ